MYSKGPFEILKGSSDPDLSLIFYFLYRRNCTCESVTWRRGHRSRCPAFGVYSSLNQLTVVLRRPLSSIMVSALNQSEPCLLTEYEGTTSTRSHLIGRLKLLGVMHSGFAREREGRGYFNGRQLRYRMQKVWLICRI